MVSKANNSVKFSQINVKLPEALHIRLKKIIIDEKMSLSEVVVEYLQKYADEHDKSKIVVC